MVGNLPAEVRAGEGVRGAKHKQLQFQDQFLYLWKPPNSPQAHPRKKKGKKLKRKRKKQCKQTQPLSLRQTHHFHATSARSNFKKSWGQGREERGLLKTRTPPPFFL